MENQTPSAEGTEHTLNSTVEKQQTPKRPTLLIVICILSFVGLGWSILQGIISLIFGKFTSSFYSMYQDMMEKSMNNMGNVPPEFEAKIESIMNSALKLIQHLPTISAVNLICSIIALGGVILMWNLKKSGFILYAVPKVFLIFFPMLLIGFNFITAIVLSSGVIFTGAFIAMYAVNLKVMK